MSEFLDFGKHAFYVWSSIAVFFIGIAVDVLMLNSKQKQVKRQIISFQKRNKNKAKAE